MARIKQTVIVPGAKGSKVITSDMRKAIANAGPGADSAGLLSDLVDVWGGTRQLAIDLHQEYQTATPGGMTRQRILEMIQRLVINNTQHEIGKQAVPSDLSDDELEALALSLVKKVNSHGTAEAPGADAEEWEG